MSNKTAFNPGQCLAVIEICEKLGVDEEVVEKYRQSAAKMTAKMLAEAIKDIDDLYRETTFGIVTPGAKNG